MTATMQDVDAVLSAGGIVRFTWSNCKAALVGCDGRSMPLDSKTYSDFLLKYQDVLSKAESGSMRERNLIVEWSIKKAPRCFTGSRAGKRR